MDTHLICALSNIDNFLSPNLKNACTFRPTIDTFPCPYCCSMAGHVLHMIVNLLGLSYMLHIYYVPTYKPLIKTEFYATPHLCLNAFFQQTVLLFCGSVNKFPTYMYLHLCKCFNPTIIDLEP